MVKREPPMRGRCVSLHLVPTIDIISQPTASVTPESAAATSAPTSTPSVSPALGVSATETGNGGRGKRPPRSQAPRDTERHAVVYPPVLKVRSSISFAEMQRAMMEHLNAVYGEGLAEDRSDEQEADDAFSQERSPRRRSFISRRFPSIIRNRIRAQGPKSQDSMSSFQKDESRGFKMHALCKGRDSSRVLGCVVCTSALLVTALLLWVAHERRTMPSVAKDELYLCDTEDCVEHARSILRSLSPKSNPCYCFYSYVCGGGGRQTAPPARKAGNFRRGASHKARPNRLARAYAQYISTFGSAQDMFSPKMALPAAAKASVALATCLTRTDEERPSQLVEFMKARKLRWPTMADDAGSVDVSGVLDILLDLSVNWKVSLWFDVSGWNTRAPGGPEVPIIVLGEPGHVPLLRMEHISRLDVSTYRSALREVAYFLATDDGSGHGGETVKPLNDASVLEELRQDETSLREALLSALGDGGVYDALISPNETGSLLRGVSDAELLNALGWMFAYCYGWIVNSTFDDFRGPARLSDVNSEGVEDDLSTYLLCFLAMEESFGIAPLAPRFARDFAPEDRGKIAAIFNATTHQLIATVQASLAISNATKLAAINKILEHTDEELWPPEPFQNLRLLDSLYAGFPSKTAGGNFYSFWFESRRALRAALQVALLRDAHDG
ncbi:hypothetical protein HPB48_013349 [Haemaphysalis longicornis]|uniref:Uncharacterized protein n=1 Tax=Haemaphysalis longicornis TaxID=44386 RepID=A0A9J6FRQ7_HAELO|nr:hypothetical protein HPB48_013349 [Haemaphysalis longicornis]